MTKTKIFLCCALLAGMAFGQSPAATTGYVGRAIENVRTGLVERIDAVEATANQATQAVAALPTHAAVTGIVDAAVAPVVDAVTALPTYEAVTGIVDDAIAAIPPVVIPPFDRVIATDDPNVWLGITASNAVLYRVTSETVIDYTRAAITHNIDGMPWPSPSVFVLGEYGLYEEILDGWEIRLDMGNPTMSALTRFAGGSWQGLYAYAIPFLLEQWEDAEDPDAPRVTVDWYRETTATTNIIKTLASTADIADALTAYYTASEIDGLLANLPAPTAPTPSILKPVHTSTATIAVTSTQAVYYVALSSPAVVTQNVSALSLNGTSEASWKIMLDLTTTNALSSTIAGVAFDSQPEFTVTGRYEFAMSSLDGIRVQAKQTWPETYAWQKTSYAYAFGTWAPSLARFDVSPINTNSLALFASTHSDSVFVRTVIAINAGRPTTYTVGISSSTGPLPPSTIPDTLYGPFTDGHGTYRTVSHVIPEGFGVPPKMLLNIWVENTTPPGPGVASVFIRPHFTFTRPLNSLERAAYDAGWRP